MNETKTLLTKQFLHAETLMRRYHIQKWSGAEAFRNPHRGQGRVLSILKLQPEMEQKEIGYLLDLSKQALAELLSKLEKAAYITRSQSEKDRRSYIIRLTDAGREAAAKVASEIADDNGAGAGFDCLSEEEQRNLSGYLTRVITALEEKLGVSDGENDYAEFFRERFFAKHGFDRHKMQRWHHDFGHSHMKVH
jgi:DNA-binding MarR family transcriptional regulator